MAQQLMGEFNEEAVRALSAYLKEPSWLTEFRLKSFQSFASLPPEKNPLYTKYANISSFDGSGFGAKPQKSEVDLRTFFKDYLTGKENNILLQGNETEVHAELAESLSATGVKLLPLHEALVLDEALVRRVFSLKMVKSEDDRFAALVNAFFNSGTFVYVPKGVEVSHPLRKMLVTNDPSTSVLEQTIIYAEEGSKVGFLEELYSAHASGPSLVASTVEVHAGPGAHVDFSSIQLLDDQAVHLSNRAIEVMNDAKATVSALSLGSAVVRSRMNFFLDGRGSQAEGFEIFFTDGKQRYDFESNLVHNSPDSSGSTQARGVLKGESQSIFKGMIRIGPSAKNSRAYLAHHAMILERTARSDAVPGLEILTNEVKATHSASVAQVDEEQLFYLMARGLPLDEARRMVVLGFFEPVLSRVPVEQTREGARFMIEGKWNGEKKRLVDRETLIALTGEAIPEVKQSEDIFERHYKYR
ncbi:MAG: Fe-S cluster assembly protein SufD [Nitrososphaerales archaeon]|nr:Fe-S cluster assembly protein SufD [Nitrososphaerales archaeon]